MRVFAKSIAFLFVLWHIQSCQGQVKQLGLDRKPVVAGSFYPSDAKKLNAQLELFFNEVDDKTIEEGLAAIIVPHAGYVFSGGVAAMAYCKIDPQKSYERIFLIGSSHHVLLSGASIYNRGKYQTPLGKVEVDTELANSLITQNKLLDYAPDAHNREHSLEVQVPFLQYWLKKPFKIVPIVIGTQTPETCKKLSKILEPYFTSENLFVVSSDFSHYPTYDDAKIIDNITGEAILENSPEAFIQAIKGNEKKQVPGLATSCCGWTSVLTLLNSTSEQPGIKVRHIKYLNSGDSQYGGHDRVVGYHSFSFVRESSTKAQGEFILTTEDKQILLAIARESIEARLAGKPYPKVDVDKLPENLKKNCGAFVTLNKHSQLRGCIGHFVPKEPLYRVVQEMAVAAAFNDHRFSPLVKAEMSTIDIEISVLTPLKRIYSVDDFMLGDQGIYIIKGNRSGTFLPQVAESTHWNKEEFLGHCARDKAGIGWEGWKDAELYTYEALVFDEKELLSHEE